MCLCCWVSHVSPSFVLLSSSKRSNVNLQGLQSDLCSLILVDFIQSSSCLSRLSCTRLSANDQKRLQVSEELSVEKLCCLMRRNPCALLFVTSQTLMDWRRHGQIGISILDAWLVGDIQSRQLKFIFLLNDNPHHNVVEIAIEGDAVLTRRAWLMSAEPRTRLWNPSQTQIFFFLLLSFWLRAGFRIKTDLLTQILCH